MSTHTAPSTGGGPTRSSAASQPLPLSGDDQGRIRTCRPARADREPEDPAALEWNIVLGED
ncbi:MULTISPECIES: hypothetical protein [Streptomyces]|uniref:Uncharacterized protein n=2 Tax=Streptomyces TaxID=1883 RepID=A0A100Y271_9ACTN|nr:MULTISPECIES: hypothetical protein [Streptomyces]KUH36331.1 hypothetical protein ATE80_24115 [Streptomyces kanasensis]UUS32098.1 hypothetical protein NRO40_15575 [Streptomyces changanensis]